MDPVPVQFYQSIVAIELAITGALLFQIRFFRPRSAAQEAGERLPDARLRVLMAVILLVTVFGALEGIRHERGAIAASAVTVGAAMSLVPILLRALPPLPKDRRADERDPDFKATIVGLIFYFLIVGAAVVALSL